MENSNRFRRPKNQTLTAEESDISRGSSDRNVMSMTNYHSTSVIFKHSSFSSDFGHLIFKMPMPNKKLLIIFKVFRQSCARRPNVWGPHRHFILKMPMPNKKIYIFKASARPVPSRLCIPVPSVFWPNKKCRKLSDVTSKKMTKNDQMVFRQ